MAVKKIEETEVKTAEVKTETAPAEVKTETKKSTGKTAGAAAKKPAAKKAASKKPAAKADEKKTEVKVQFAGNEYDVDTIVEACKADYKNNNKGYVKTISVYIKPEESTAYYVVNGKTSDKIDL